MSDTFHRTYSVNLSADGGSSIAIIVEAHTPCHAVQRACSILLEERNGVPYLMTTASVAPVHTRTQGVQV